ncbi:hypothetical protein U1Q18_005665 [Sarracenia purpurea var. burkii]
MLVIVRLWLLPPGFLLAPFIWDSSILLGCGDFLLCRVPRRLFICRSRYCCVALAGVKFFGAVAFLLSVFKGDSNCLLGFSLQAAYCWCPSQFAAGFSRHAAPVWFSRGFGHAPVSKGFIRGLAILG